MTEHYPLYLNGDWIDSPERLPVQNPATGDIFAEVASIGRTRVGEALADANAAFTDWRNLTALARGDYLLAVAGELSARFDTIARTITMENGKPLAQSEAEVTMTIDHFRWFAEEGRRTYGRVVPHQAEGKRHLVLKHPVGVVGAIAPWNFPLALAARKVAPALAAGCPVLLKPAAATPVSSVLLAQCIEAAGLPPGVFQLLVGNAAEIGSELLENPICRKISFTGSSAVGKQIIRNAADSCTKLSLELGGNAPVLIFEDADFQQAVEGALITKFRNTGQSCVAANRIYVQRTIYDRFLEAFVSRVRAMRVGNGLEKGVEIGPLIDTRGLDNALRFVAEAKSDGARLLCGGERWGEAGSFLTPSVLADIPPQSRCLREEIFAPIAAISPFDSEAEVIATANATEYGLAAYAFT
ncbi:MAG: NAD-dependent succinate-semialdehyde dehydrogenase, partial [Desulfobacterales bacterium]|nr:NAD-dependent succinate-semialdehyde dehydrogenase [Desulfobacterales bacterium]